MLDLYNFKIESCKIVDGDTITDARIDLGFNVILIDKTIRLIGIDTPDLKSKNIELKKIAKKAKEYLQDWIEKADYVILQSKSKREDKYGRLLGEIIVEVGGIELNINELLIKEKLAVRYKGDKKLTEVEMLKALDFEEIRN